MTDNGKRVNGLKPMIEVNVFLLEDGNVAVKSSSNKALTTIGLLEAAKQTYFQPKAEESRIARV